MELLNKRGIKPRVRILLAHRDAVFSKRLARGIAGQQDMELCGELQSASAIAKAVRTGNPQIAVIDLGLVEDDLLGYLRSLHAAFPSLRILAVSGHADTEQAECVLRAGAGGYVVQSEPLKEMLLALRIVAGGQLYVSRGAAAPLLRRLLQSPSKISSRPSLGEHRQARVGLPPPMKSP